MNVAIVLEQRFSCTPDGAVWAQTAASYSFWKRYLEVFDGVRVVARVQKVETPPANAVRADGPKVQFLHVPYYLGPWQYIQRAKAVKNATLAAIQPQDAVILRVPSTLANGIFGSLYRNGRPYGVEVVGDPWDVFAPGVIQHPLRVFLRKYFCENLRKQCRHASAAAYVTERTLQARYPVGPTRLSIAYSSVELPDEAFVDTPRNRTIGNRPLRLIFVGSLAQLYKGPDVLLEATALCIARNTKLELTIVGDGRYLSHLKSQADQLGIAEHVCFLGELPPGNAVRTQLDQADVFVLPSRTEGLPRALIEAMARGLPCIASTAGGIPELLPPDDLAPPGNAAALAELIRNVAGDPNRRQAMALRNLTRARDFHADVLRQRRNTFYQYLRDCTRAWLHTRNAA